MIRRYFPGQVPDWIDSKEKNQNQNQNNKNNNKEEEEENDEIRIEIDIPKSKEVDRRLARISQSTSQSTSTNGRNRRRIYEAEVIEEPSDLKTNNEFDNIKQGDILEGDSPYIQKLEEQEENEEDVAARRQRIREKLASKRNELENQQQKQSSGIISLAEKMAQSKPNESSSEYETDTDATDSDEDDNSNHKLLKPIFVSKQYRETIRQQEEQEKLEEIKQQNKLLKYEEKKHQTKVLLAEYLKKQSETNINDVTDNDSDAGLPDDYDDPNDEEEEYNLWKIREIKRMKREMEFKEESIRDVNEINRRRNMTDEERYQEDVKLGKFQEKEKKQWKFLQKYYHKGVFYMDEKSTKNEKTHIQSQYNNSSNYNGNNNGDDDGNKLNQKKIDVRLREYDEPTLEDKFNKETLPAILQVKKFGMRGRTKYTHLSDQDTSSQNALGIDQRIQSNYMSKRAGVGDINTGKKKQRME